MLAFAWTTAAAAGTARSACRRPPHRAGIKSLGPLSRTPKLVGTVVCASGTCNALGFENAGRA